jgi:hypothetical protein
MWRGQCGIWRVELKPPPQPSPTAWERESTCRTNNKAKSLGLLNEQRYTDRSIAAAMVLTWTIKALNCGKVSD